MRTWSLIGVIAESIVQERAAPSRESTVSLMMVLSVVTSSGALVPFKCV